MQNHQNPHTKYKSKKMKTALFHSKKYISSISKKSLTPMQIFSLLCEIPHKSYHTQEMFEYLCGFCENLGLEVRTDKAKNIYICKKVQKCESKKESFINMDNVALSNTPKTPSPKICLQAHYDMVGVGRAERGEVIVPYIDGQFLRARESSLGADNGVGVASILWLFMQEKYAPHIEAIFTNDEEVGLCGANELELPIKSRFLLNLDSEFFGEIITGCAGGFDVEFDFGTYCHKSVESMQKECEYGEANLQELRLYEIEAFGFEGGHSGIDIDKNICSSIVEFAKLLEVLCDDFGENISVLYELGAGEKSNSIPVGLHAIMGFGFGMEELEFALKQAGLMLESSTNVDEKALCVGLVDFGRDCSQDCLVNNDGIKTGFLLKPYSQIGDYKQILKQKPYDKRLLAKVVLGLHHGVWERDEEGCVSSSLNVAMIASNSPLGMQCGKILDFLECTDAKSANIPKNPKNLHSHTANTRIVDSSKQIDSSENGSLSSLDKNPQDSRGNLSGIASDLQNTQLELQGDCHESAYADSRNDEKTRECNADFDKSISNDNMACRPEGVGNNARSISNAQNRDFSLIAQNDNDRDISGLSPQYDKNTSALYNHDDLSNFYPNSLLITGFDILFFWVARMLFSGESLLGKLPFRDVYLHALVRDENGQKMSKSRGNVIDPLEMIDKYGADSLRFSLAYLCAQGRDIRLSSAQLELSKNFANKLFNATQFLILYARQMDSNFNGFTEIGTIAQYQTSLGKYAKSRLNVANKELIDALESYRFNDGASVLYRFLWGEFCDWCIELAKAQKEAINELGSVLIDALKLLHPYMPFISEDLYHTLKGQKLQSSQSIMIAEFPSDFAQDLHIEAEFEGIKNAVISLRRLKASVDLANKPLQKAYIEFDNYTPNTTQKALESIQKLSRIQFVELFDSTQVNIKQCVADIGEGVKCYLPLSEIDLSPILSRLNSQKQKLQKECDKLESNLKNDKFLSNAPKEVVAKLESNLKETQQRLDKIQSEINALDMR